MCCTECSLLSQVYFFYQSPWGSHTLTTASEMDKTLSAASSVDELRSCSLLWKETSNWLSHEVWYEIWWYLHILHYNKMKSVPSLTYMYSMLYEKVDIFNVSIAFIRRKWKPHFLNEFYLYGSSINSNLCQFIAVYFLLSEHLLNSSVQIQRDGTVLSHT